MRPLWDPHPKLSHGWHSASSLQQDCLHPPPIEDPQGLVAFLDGHRKILWICHSCWTTYPYHLPRKIYRALGSKRQSLKMELRLWQKFRSFGEKNEWDLDTWIFLFCTLSIPQILHWESSLLNPSILQYVVFSKTFKKQRKQWIYTKGNLLSQIS